MLIKDLDRAGGYWGSVYVFAAIRGEPLDVSRGEVLVEWMPPQLGDHVLGLHGSSPRRLASVTCAPRPMRGW